jgi:hypothetical protein
MPLRRKVWEKLAGHWKPAVLKELTTEIGLEDLDQGLDRVLQGQRQGRIIVGLWE